MWKNASFGLIVLFWVTMNALLWHAEMGPGHDLASAVPVEMVWEKMLKAPDDSALSVYLNEQKIGFLRWKPNVGEEAATGKIASENEPEGIVRRLTEYTLDVEGSLANPSFGRSVRLGVDIRFGTDLRWKRFEGQTVWRPAVWKIKGDAAERALWLHGEDGDTEWIRRLSFDELGDPKKLLEQVDSPLIVALLSQNPLPQATQMRIGLDWTAEYEWLNIGRNRVRVYRLRARLLDRYEVNVLVSRVGEILRADFPGNLKLINEVLFSN